MDRSFEAWWSSRRPALLRFAYAITAGDAGRAEDLLQVAVTRVWKRWGQLIERQVDVDAYLRKIVLNEHVAFWRVQRNRREVAYAQVPDEPVDSQTDLVDDVDLVWRALAGLPRRQQAVLGLRYAEDMTDHQIAEILGISESAVRSYAARAIATIRTRTGVPTAHRANSRNTKGCP